ncbi:MAG TPA: COX15/CtaA family protein [Gemmatimonadaceae bacterium]|nr:COX15/CtaA family protein [Gemmatimonadaceae bacterium]
MTPARIATTAVLLTYLHLVFGGVVRITGSGMGCGDHWPKCNGSWIPPFNDPTVMIEWTHRLLALLVILSILWLVIAARRHRSDAGIAAPGAVFRPALLALVLVVAVALLGMVTVKVGNTALATVAHWTLAMTLLAVLLVAAVRSGAFGGTAVATQPGTARAMRSIGAGAAFAFAIVVLGGVVAKSPGAAVACSGFPLCGDAPAGVPAGATHIQLTHRILAYLLFFHAIAIAIAVGRRGGESAMVRRAAKVAAGLVVLQVVIAAAMVLSMLPHSLRVLHQAVGVAVWLAMFLAAYLARRAASAPRLAA